MIRVDIKDKETLVTFWCDCGKEESINLKEVLRKRFVKEAIERRAKDYRDKINEAKNKNELLEYRARLSVCLLILLELGL